MCVGGGGVGGGVGCVWVVEPSRICTTRNGRNSVERGDGAIFGEHLKFH